MRDLGDVSGARNAQFEQEFLGLFRAETVSAYDWRDRIGGFCVADYLAELDIVHVMRYSTRLSLAPHELMPAQPVITTARECSLALRQRGSQDSYAVIIREVSRTRSLSLIPVRHVRRSRSQPTLKST